MTPTDIIKAIAELDGWKHEITESLSGKVRIEHWHCHGKKPFVYHECNLPPYLTSRDAIVPVIEKQSEEVKTKVVSYFIDERSIYCDLLNLLEATPTQLCKALLRATRKWVE